MFATPPSALNNLAAWVKAPMEEAMQEVAKVRPHIVPVQAGAAVGDY